MNKITPEYVLERGVAQILPSKKALLNLIRQRKITLYQGFDPSSKSLHLGNLIGIRKLSQFQELGHRVVFLIGDFTGMIGDPTDKSAARIKMTRQEVLQNAKGWQKQVEKVIDFKGKNKAEVKYNSSWLSKLSFGDVVELASNFTVQQMLERDFFQERLKVQKPIYLHEFLYPLMQGYDSVAMKVDLEIGGSDQLFNMMAGRSLSQSLIGKDKSVLTLKLLADPSGKKMGKSEGNVVGLTEKPISMYGKVMALPDTIVDPAVELLTDLPLDSLKGLSPLKAKKRLAFEIVAQVHGKTQASSAQEAFEKTFQEKEPEYKKEVKAKPNLLETIASLTKSRSEAKRLISQQGVDVNGTTVSDPTFKISGGEKIKIGKRTFVRVTK